MFTYSLSIRRTEFATNPPETDALLCTERYNTSNPEDDFIWFHYILHVADRALVIVL